MIEAVEKEIATAEEEIEVELHLGNFGGFVEFGCDGLIDGAEGSDERAGDGMRVGYGESVNGVEDVGSVVVVA